jgi:hypothetical protein
VLVFVRKLRERGSGTLGPNAYPSREGTGMAAARTSGTFARHIARANCGYCVCKLDTQFTGTLGSHRVTPWLSAVHRVTLFSSLGRPSKEWKRIHHLLCHLCQCPWPGDSSFNEPGSVNSAHGRSGVFIRVNSCRDFVSWKIFEFKSKRLQQTETPQNGNLESSRLAWLRFRPGRTNGPQSFTPLRINCKRD